MRGVFFRDQAIAVWLRGHKVGVTAPIMHSLRTFLSGSQKVKSVREEKDQGVVTLRRDVWAYMPRIPFGNYILWKQAADLLLERYIEKHGRPEIVHAHSALFAGAVAANWKKRFGIPFALTEHSTAFARDALPLWQMRLAKKAAAAADYRIAVSPALGELLSETMGSGATDWTWIPNIVADRFRWRGKEKPGINRRVRFLNLALMTEKKGQIDLMEAFSEGFRMKKEVELWFGGDGPLNRQLKTAAEKLGVKDRVRFLGRIAPAKVPELFRSVDVLVVSSHYETFGLVAAEALMCGVPVVATRCGGPECIVQEGDGLLVPPGDPVKLSEALLKMVDLLPELDSQAISDRARQRFSSDAVGRQLDDIYADPVLKG